MLNSIHLRNFKSFSDSGEIRLAPLTLIFGRNNTGKSTILQSLLLLRQSLDSPGYGPRLNPRGPLYSVSSYADIVHGHQAKNHIQMAFEFEPEPRDKRPSGKIEFEFVGDEPQPPRINRLTITSPEVPPLEIRRGRGAGGPYELLIGHDRLGGEKSANFRFSVGRFLPAIGSEGFGKQPNQTRERVRGRARRLLLDFDFMLREMKAVGAFRRQPDRRYEYQGVLPGNVDLSGERVVAALIDDITRRKGRGELFRSVNRWLREVGQVRLLPLRRLSKAARIFEVRVRDRDSGRWANLSDVGFGISQAFPVIVEGLRTRPGAIFLVQEPEIHLHPDAQLAMADFLIGLVASGRQVIVETHSEHLLLRVRRAILGKRRGHGAGPNLTPESVSLIHVDARSDGTSHAQRLDIDSVGQVAGWPRGFMEEATKERLTILKAMASQVGIKAKR
ncbi:MAG: AAA family ATPase [Acidobacteria bacterium]|nr:AAA family ATPase [Acidobacteriota bacterium]